MTEESGEQVRSRVAQWWTTAIIDIEPGKIGLRGRPIQELIGAATFTDTIWLMLRGELPSASHRALLDAALTASVDHGPHAPSIAIARMAVTCGVDLNSAMSSAIGVLGDVHGGAGQHCMELLERVRAARAGGLELATAVDEVLASFVAEHGKFIPGFGHRFHPVDPRCEPLLGLVERTAAEGGVSGEFAAIGRAVAAGLERRSGKRIPMNIDGATAVIFCELGFPPPLGRGLFILSRSVGILAHAWEQSEQGGRNKGPIPREMPYRYSGPPTRTRR